MYFINPDYIAQVFLENNPPNAKNRRRVAKAQPRERTSPSPTVFPKPRHSRLWTLVHFHQAYS